MKKKTGAAVFIAALLAVNSASVVFAQRKTGTGYGIGSFEGNVKPGVLNIELPLETENGEADPKLGFILDPNDLISKTKAARYKDVTFDGTQNSCFYFRNTVVDEDDNEKISFSNKSDELTAVNKTLKDVAVSVTATLTDYEGIDLTGDSDDFKATVDKPTILVSLEDNDAGNDAECIVDVGAGATATLESVLTASNPDAFVVEYSEANQEYRYNVGTYANQNPDMFSKYSFWINGLIAKNDSTNQTDWSDVSETIAPRLELVWAFKDQPADDELPGLERKTVKLSRDEEGKTINFSLGGANNLASGITQFKVSGTGLSSLDVDYISSPNSNYFEIDLVEETITIKKAFAEAVASYGTGGTIDVMFNDKSATTATLTFTVG